MKIPVIFLAFSNDQDDHLALLEEERKAITGHLVPLANEQYFQLFAESSAATADLSRYVSEFKDRIAIFHYGGHAGSSQIFLADQAAAAGGLAQLLGLQKDLKLVFLNGCSTKAQVELLFQQHIPAVIATSIPVEDPSAREFADVFYRSLVTQHSLEEAFKLAAANYFMKKGESVGIFRGLDVDVDPGKENQLPWGLYINKDATAVLDWKLPRQTAASFIVRGAAKRYQPGVTMNQKIIETLANATAPFSENIADLIETAKRKGRDPKLRDLRVAVIDSFPTPIGTHLRKLLLSEDVSTDRLRKIVNVYDVSAQFLATILLAQLWDEKHKNEKIIIPEESIVLLNAYFDLVKEQAALFNFVTLIRAVSDIFEVNKTDFFVEELAKLRTEFFQESKFQQAHLFLEEMKKELQGSIAADEIESFCVQAEEHLCEVFRHLGFCAKYTLATIKTIELLKKRHEDPTYRHNLVVLDKITASFGVLDDVLISEEFTDNESVVLLYNDENAKPSLNLSPFLIDENALSGQQNSKIFFFRYREAGNYFYILIDNLKDELRVSEDQYSQVKEEFDRFFRTLRND